MLDMEHFYECVAEVLYSLQFHEFLEFTKLSWCAFELINLSDNFMKRSAKFTPFRPSISILFEEHKKQKTFATKLKAPKLNHVFSFWKCFSSLGLHVLISAVISLHSGLNSGNFYYNIMKWNADFLYFGL